MAEFELPIRMDRPEFVPQELWDKATVEQRLFVMYHEAMHRAIEAEIYVDKLKLAIRDFQIEQLKKPTIFANTDPKDRVPDSIPKHLKDRVVKLDLEPSRKAWKKWKDQSK